MEANELLIQQADMKKDGTNVHSFNEAICNYRASIDVANGTAWWIQGKPDIEDHKEMGKIKAELWECYLMKFVSTGVFDKNVKPRCYI
jgi:hypothetical protein